MVLIPVSHKGVKDCALSRGNNKHSVADQENLIRPTKSYRSPIGEARDASRDVSLRRRNTNRRTFVRARPQGCCTVAARHVQLAVDEMSRSGEGAD